MSIYTKAIMEMLVSTDIYMEKAFIKFQNSSS